jgi:hypothetical protein
MEKYKMKTIPLRHDEILEYTDSELCDLLFGIGKEAKVWIIQELIKEEKERRRESHKKDDPLGL